MKVKKKLKDLTPEEYKNWRTKYCIGDISSGSHSTCDDCPLTSVICNGIDKKIWVNNKDLYSDKFLNQEIEIEEPNILNKKEKEYLDKKEREYLENVIKPFKNNIQYIIKQTGPTGLDNSDYEYITIFIKTTTNIAWLGQEYIVFPLFKKGTMYNNMKVENPYTLEELGLFLKKE